jgi:hypothetical protein
MSVCRLSRPSSDRRHRESRLDIARSTVMLSTAR